VASLTTCQWVNRSRRNHAGVRDGRRGSR
jgi:hypothetical protein